ncbi:MAG: hypothetical protein LBT45_00970 [Rickettsiales bacterium]|jgi:hypothetical protein|nr:hypothetical protein [Rickettsiales bacterium]
MLKVLKKIPHRVWMILTRPERFFKKIVVDGSLEESMIKCFLFGLLGGVAVLAINLISGATVTFGGVFVKVVAYPLIAVGVLFVFAGLMMMFAEITGGNRDWELAVKGTSSIFFMYPVILILDALAFNCTSLWAINLLVDGYVLFLLYNIAKHCMKGKKWAVLSVIALAAIFLIMIYNSEYKIRWLAMKNPAAAVACLAQ